MNTGHFCGAHGLLRRTMLAGGIAGLGLVLSGCEEPQPRGFADFMEDSIAREGVIARCDLDPRAARDDIECANARRAAVAIALEQERNRLELLEQESERKLQALRQQVANAERAAAESAEIAATAEQQAYERLWREQTQAASEAGGDPASSEPTDEPGQWSGSDAGLPFSPLNRVDPVAEGELAEALDSAATPAP